MENWRAPPHPKGSCLYSVQPTVAMQKYSPVWPGLDSREARNNGSHYFKTLNGPITHICHLTLALEFSCAGGQWLSHFGVRKTDLELGG